MLSRCGHVLPLTSLALLLLTSCLQVQLGREVDETGPRETDTLRRGLQQTSTPARWEAPHSKCTKVHLTAGDPPTPIYTTSYWKAHFHPPHSPELLAQPHRKAIKDDPMCARSPCPAHSACYLGACVCHPGWHGDTCERKLDVANPWYTSHCPNLFMDNTMDVSLPLNMTGGEHSPRSAVTTTATAIASNLRGSSAGAAACPAASRTGICAYLCFSHPSYGTAAVPLSLWRAAQTAEGDLWVKEGADPRLNSANDRAAEHWASFSNFAALPNGTDGQVRGDFRGHDRGTSGDARSPLTSFGLSLPLPCTAGGPARTRDRGGRGAVDVASLTSLSHLSPASLSLRWARGRGRSSRGSCTPAPTSPRAWRSSPCGSPTPSAT
jgi:hypothetical protein